MEVFLLLVGVLLINNTIAADYDASKTKVTNLITQMYAGQKQIIDSFQLVDSDNNPYCQMASSFRINGHGEADDGRDLSVYVELSYSDCQYHATFKAEVATIYSFTLLIDDVSINIDIPHVEIVANIGTDTFSGFLTSETKFEQPDPFMCGVTYETIIQVTDNYGNAILSPIPGLAVEYHFDDLEVLSLPCDSVESTGMFRCTWSSQRAAQYWFKIRLISDLISEVKFNFTCYSGIIHPENTAISGNGVTTDRFAVGKDYEMIICLKDEFHNTLNWFDGERIQAGFTRFPIDTVMNMESIGNSGCSKVTFILALDGSYEGNITVFYQDTDGNEQEYVVHTFSFFIDGDLNQNGAAVLSIYGEHPDLIEVGDDDLFEFTFDNVGNGDGGRAFGDVYFCDALQLESVKYFTHELYLSDPCITFTASSSDESYPHPFAEDKDGNPLQVTNDFGFTESFTYCSFKFPHATFPFDDDARKIDLKFLAIEENANCMGGLRGGFLGSTSATGGVRKITEWYYFSIEVKLPPVPLPWVTKREWSSSALTGECHLQQSVLSLEVTESTTTLANVSFKVEIPICIAISAVEVGFLTVLSQPNNTGSGNAVETGDNIIEVFLPRSLTSDDGEVGITIYWFAPLKCSDGQNVLPPETGTPRHVEFPYNISYCNQTVPETSWDCSFTEIGMKKTTLKAVGLGSSVNPVYDSNKGHVSYSQTMKTSEYFQFEDVVFNNVLGSGQIFTDDTLKYFHNKEPITSSNTWTQEELVDNSSSLSFNFSAADVEDDGDGLIGNCDEITVDYICPIGDGIGKCGCKTVHGVALGNKIELSFGIAGQDITSGITPVEGSIIKQLGFQIPYPELRVQLFRRNCWDRNSIATIRIEYKMVIGDFEDLKLYVKLSKTFLSVPSVPLFINEKKDTDPAVGTCHYVPRSSNEYLNVLQGIYSIIDKNTLVFDFGSHNNFEGGINSEIIIHCGIQVKDVVYPQNQKGVIETKAMEGGILSSGPILSEFFVCQPKIGIVRMNTFMSDPLRWPDDGNWDVHFGDELACPANDETRAISGNSQEQKSFYKQFAKTIFKEVDVGDILTRGIIIPNDGRASAKNVEVVVTLSKCFGPPSCGEHMQVINLNGNERLTYSGSIFSESGSIIIHEIPPQSKAFVTWNIMVLEDFREKDYGKLNHCGRCICKEGSVEVVGYSAGNLDFNQLDNEMHNETSPGDQIQCLEPKRVKIETFLDGGEICGNTSFLTFENGQHFGKVVLTYPKGYTYNSWIKVKFETDNGIAFSVKPTKISVGQDLVDENGSNDDLYYRISHELSGQFIDDADTLAVFEKISFGDVYNSGDSSDVANTQIILEFEATSSVMGGQGTIRAWAYDGFYTHKGEEKDCNYARSEYEFPQRMKVDTHVEAEAPCEKINTFGKFQNLVRHYLKVVVTFPETSVTPSNKAPIKNYLIENAKVAIDIQTLIDSRYKINSISLPTNNFDINYLLETPEGDNFVVPSAASHQHNFNILLGTVENTKDDSYFASQSKLEIDIEVEYVSSDGPPSLQISASVYDDCNSLSEDHDEASVEISTIKIDTITDAKKWSCDENYHPVLEQRIAMDVLFPPGLTEEIEIDMFIHELDQTNDYYTFTQRQYESDNFIQLPGIQTLSSNVINTANSSTLTLNNVQCNPTDDKGFCVMSILYKWAGGSIDFHEFTGRLRFSARNGPDLCQKHMQTWDLNKKCETPSPTPHPTPYPSPPPTPSPTNSPTWPAHMNVPVLEPHTRWYDVYTNAPTATSISYEISMPTLVPYVPNQQGSVTQAFCLGFGDNCIPIYGDY